MLLDGSFLCLRRLLTLFFISTCLTGCLNGNLQWSRSSDSARAGAEGGSVDGGNTGGGSSGGGATGSGGGGGRASDGPLKVTSILPAQGSWHGGFSLTVTGTGFAEGATVKLGSYNCIDAVRTSDTTLNCIVPEVSPNTFYDVTVTNPNQASDTKSEAFTSKTFAYVARTSAIDRSLHSYTMDSDGTLETHRIETTYSSSVSIRAMVYHPTKPVLYALVHGGAADEIRPYSIGGTNGTLTGLNSRATSTTSAQNLCLGPNVLHIVGSGDGTIGELYTVPLDTNGEFSSGANTITPAGAMPLSCVVAQNKYVYVLNGQEGTISSYLYVNGIPFQIGGAAARYNLGASGPMAVSPNGQYLVVASPREFKVMQINSGDGSLTGIGNPAFTQDINMADLKFIGAETMVATQNDTTTGTYGVRAFSFANGVATPLDFFEIGISGTYKLAPHPSGQSVLVGVQGNSTIQSFPFSGGVIGNPTDSQTFEDPSALVVY